MEDNRQQVVEDGNHPFRNQFTILCDDSGQHWTLINYVHGLGVWVVYSVDVTVAHASVNS